MKKSTVYKSEILPEEERDEEINSEKVSFNAEKRGEKGYGFLGICILKFNLVRF